MLFWLEVDFDGEKLAGAPFGGEREGVGNFPEFFCIHLSFKCVRLCRIFVSETNK